MRTIAPSVCLVVLLICSVAHADIYRWDNGELIPGTEGIDPGPGVQLDHRELGYAALSGLNLTASGFGFSNLSYANLSSSTLTAAHLTGAVVTGTNLGNTTSRGFTQAQLVSTASYQAKNLQGIVLGQNNLTAWDLSGQNFTDAYLWYSTLANADLTGANLTNAYLYDSTLPNADLTGANLTDAQLHNSTLTNASLAGANLTDAVCTASPQLRLRFS
jgi:uncharacterized protein YjbI with pentapeptide repeats